MSVSRYEWELYILWVKRSPENKERDVSWLIDEGGENNQRCILEMIHQTYNFI